MWYNYSQAVSALGVLRLEGWDRVLLLLLAVRDSIALVGTDRGTKKSMKHKNLVVPAASLLLTVSLLVACGAPESASHSLLIPVGRSAVIGGNTFQVLIDTEPYDPQVTYDDYGGYWIEIPYDLQENSEVLLQITVEDERAGLYREESEDLQRWLSPSELINSDNPALTAEAEKLTVDSNSAIEKAQRIQRFVISHLEFTNS